MILIFQFPSIAYVLQLDNWAVVEDKISEQSDFEERQPKRMQ